MATWGANQWVRFTQEATYGTYASGGSLFWVRLVGDNAFSMIPAPQRYELRSADGGNRRTQNISSRVVLAGSLSTVMYATQAAALLGWASTLTSNDLPSYTADHFDGQEVRRYLGCKVAKLSGSCAAETNEGAMMTSLDLVAQTTGTPPTLAQPAFSVFPTEIPYTHEMSAGGLTLAAVARTAYRSFNFSIANMLKPTFDELPYITGAYYCGRDVDFNVDYQYVNTNDRVAYEAQTAQAYQVTFTNPGPSKALTLNFQGAVRQDKRTRSLPLGDIGREQYEYHAFLDPTSATDFGFTET